jgi:hypothetical protein
MQIYPLHGDWVGVSADLDAGDKRKKLSLSEIEPRQSIHQAVAVLTYLSRVLNLSH